MNLAALLFDVARRLPDRPAVSDGHSFVELSRADRARCPHRRRLARPWSRAGRPGAAEPRKLRRVLRAAVRLLGGRAMCGAGQCPAPPARGRVYRRQFGGAAAGRDARSCRGAGAARRHGRHAGRDHLDPNPGLRPAAQRRAAASRAGETDRPGLAVLHLRNHRTAEGRDADPPQPALRQLLLLCRHRPARRARHAPARRAGVARRRPLRAAVSAEGRRTRSSCRISTWPTSSRWSGGIRLCRFSPRRRC